MKINLKKCPKCGAGRGSLYEDRAVMDVGTATAIACRQCGWSAFTTDVVTVKREEAPKKKPTTAECRKTDWTPCPCCSIGRVYVVYNNTGLCSRCGNRLRSWKRNHNPGPCPFIKDVRGQWMKNPELKNVHKIRFNFPETTFSQNNTSAQQVEHVLSEAVEIHRSIEEGEPIQRTEEELFDLLHSAEGAVMVLIREKGVQYVLDSMNKVIAKNAKRGYYPN